MLIQIISEQMFENYINKPRGPDNVDALKKIATKKAIKFYVLSGLFDTYMLILSNAGFVLF